MNNRIIKCRNDFCLSICKNYSINEARIVAGILYKISSQLSVYDEFKHDEDIVFNFQKNNVLEVSTKFIKECLKVSKITNKRMVETLNNIMNMNFIVYKSDGNFEISCLFTNIRKEGDKIFFHVNEKLEEYLNELNNNFTILELGEFSLLKTKHSQSLYMFAMRYLNFKNGNFEMYLDDVKDYLSITNYKRMYDIDKMLKRSIEEIEKTTNLTVKYDKRKNGKKVEKIKFILSYEGKLFSKQEKKEC